jgi:hypothetical protein
MHPVSDRASSPVSSSAAARASPLLLEIDLGGRLAVGIHEGILGQDETRWEDRSSRCMRTLVILTDCRCLPGNEITQLSMMAPSKHALIQRRIH